MMHRLLFFSLVAVRHSETDEFLASVVKCRICNRALCFLAKSIARFVAS
jgi:hypothetical protein